MGCDIHGGYEAFRKVFRDDDKEDWKEWKYQGEIDGARKYSAWFAIAGVRHGPIPPIWAGRGLPKGRIDEVSDTNRELHELWGADAHSPTWVLLSEMKAAGHPELLGSYIDEMEIIRVAYGLADDQVRMVCWFDN